jgi:hypothetical protein
MASRLVNIVTERLLSVEEAFGNMDPAQLAALLQPLVEGELLKEPHGEVLVTFLHPFLPFILTRVVKNLQKEIASILDLKTVVLEAFVRDKGVLVELFQKVKPSSHPPSFALSLRVGGGYLFDSNYHASIIHLCQP